MENVSLRPIDKNNWEEASDLTVKEEQKRFMVSNLYSIAEVQFLENFLAKGVYLEDRLVGFTMFGIDSDDGNYWIYRFMIDQKYQGRGISNQAIKLIIDAIRDHNTTNIPLIMIGYHPENQSARYAYKKAGFIETVIAPWGEQLAKFEL